MNLDVALEVIDNKVYKYAEHVILNTEGTDGVLHNVKGSVAKTAVNTSWRDGGGSNVGSDWICTGLYTSNDESKIYMFLYATTSSPIGGLDYLDSNMLFEYTISTNTWKTVLAGIDSNINWSSQVLDANIISFREQEFLFWLNYDGVPYKVEVAEAIQFTKKIGEGNTYTDDEFNAITSVIQAPPLFPPTIEYIKDSNITLNRYIIGIYSFKYRYIYDNGGVSAFSPVSKIFYDYTVSNGVDNSEAISYNAIEVEYKENVSNIESVEIAFKRDTEWFLIPSVPSNDIGSYTYSFLNDKTYRALGESSLETKYYDNVPLSAITQEFIKNKISYGNYLDNYDSVTDLSMSGTAIYKDYGGDTISIPFAFRDELYGLDYGASYLGANTDNHIEITLASIQGLAEIGDIIHYKIYEPTTYNNYAVTSSFMYQWSSEGTVTISDWNTILEDLFNSISQNSSYIIYPRAVSYNEEVQLDHTNVGGLLTMFLQSNYVDSLVGAIIKRLPLKHSFTDSIGQGAISEPAPPSELLNTFTLDVTESSTNASFKYGASHQLGVVYYDKFNRQNDVAITEDSLINVKWIYERISLANELNGAASLLWEIDSTPPIWATHYQIVYSKNTNTKDFDTFLCDNLLPVSDFDASDVSGNMRIVMDSLTKFQKSNIATSLEYIYNEGDRVYLIGHWDEADVELKYTDNALSAAVLDSGFDETDGYQYVTISAESATMFQDHLNQYLYANADWKNRFPMEIRSSYANATDGVFYEFGEVYNIGNVGEVDRYHLGESRNQNDIVSGSITESFSKSGENRYFSPVNGSAPYGGWKIGDYVRIWDLTAPAVFVYGFITDQDGDEEIKVNTIDDSVFNIASGSKNIERVQAALGSVDYGDSYIRSRVYIPTWGGTSPSYTPMSVITQVDTQLASDVFAIHNDGFGRSQIIKQDKVAITRDASIIISQSINEDTNFFGTTSFPNTAFDFVDLDNSFSGIDKLVNLNDNLYVLQDSRVGIQQVAKDILTTASGDGSVSITSDVFGNFLPILDGVGTRGNTKYIQNFEGKLFFVDPEGKVGYMVAGREAKDITSNGVYNEMITSNFSVGGSSGIIPNRKEYLLGLSSGRFSYSIKYDKWICKHKFSASQMVHANGKYYSTNFDRLVEHESSVGEYNKFYNDEGFLEVMPSIVTVVSNDKKFMNKSYESVALSGNGIDTAKLLNISTNISTTSDINTLDNQEGILYSFIGGGSKIGNTFTGKPLGIGEINDGIAPDKGRFTFKLPNYVAIGDNFYQDDSGVQSLGTITAILDNGDGSYTVTVSGGQPLPNKYAFITKPSEKDGVDMKGQYIKMDIEFGRENTPQYISALDLEGTISELNH